MLVLPAALLITENKRCGSYTMSCIRQASHSQWAVLSSKEENDHNPKALTLWYYQSIGWGRVGVPSGAEYTTLEVQVLIGMNEH